MRSGIVVTFVVVTLGLATVACQRRGGDADHGTAKSPGTETVPPSASAPNAGGATPGAASPGAASKAGAITDVEWTLVELDGQKSAATPDEQPPTLRLAQEGSLASGFAGCNRFSGTYKLEGGSLQFTPLAMTRMACVKGMEIEQRYAAALTATRAYRFVDGTLELSDGQRVLARFTHGG